MNSSFLRKIAATLFLMTIPAGVIYAATYPAKDELYRGVYWPGESTWDGEPNKWDKVDSALKQLKAHNINAIWLTHTSAADAGKFARLGEAYGIKIVASLSYFAWDQGSVREQANRDFIADHIADYGDAPLPIAWGLGDEMIGSISTMPSYVAMWRTNFPGVPITATFMWGGDLRAAGAMNFDYLTCDFYPFFAENSKNGPTGEASASWWIDRINDVTSHTDTSAMDDRPWFIPQSFQEPLAPWNLDAQGNMVYLPTGGTVWPMPTPAQITWQALTAVGHGVKGLFYFLYRNPMDPDPTGTPYVPCSEPGCETTTRNSGSPRGLTYDDGRATPQLTALGSAYAWIMSLDSAIKTAKVVSSSGLVSLASDPAEYGTFSKTLYDQRTDKYIHFLVASYLGTAAYSYELILPLTVSNVVDAATGQPLTLETAGGLYHLKRSIKPGMAVAITFKMDASNLPISFEEDFSTRKALSYARESESVAWYDFLGDGVISAANNGITMGDAYIVFNVDSLLGAAASGLRQLEYKGSASPDQGEPERGVWWSVSNDGITFTKISANEFDKMISFSGKYLRAQLSFYQAGGQQTGGMDYGSLSWFKVSQAGGGTAAQVRHSGVDLHASMLPQSAPSLRELGRLMQQGGYAVRLYNVNGSLIWAGRGMATPPDHLLRSNGIVIIEIKHLQTGALKQWRTASVR